MSAITAASHTWHGLSLLFSGLATWVLWDTPDWTGPSGLVAADPDQRSGWRAGLGVSRSSVDVWWATRRRVDPRTCSPPAMTSFGSERRTALVPPPAEAGPLALISAQARGR